MNSQNLVEEVVTTAATNLSELQNLVEEIESPTQIVGGPRQGASVIISSGI